MCRNTTMKTPLLAAPLRSLLREPHTAKIGHVARVAHLKSSKESSRRVRKKSSGHAVRWGEEAAEPKAKQQPKSVQLIRGLTSCDVETMLPAKCLADVGDPHEQERSQRGTRSIRREQQSEQAASQPRQAHSGTCVKSTCDESQGNTLH